MKQLLSPFNLIGLLVFLFGLGLFLHFSHPPSPPPVRLPALATPKLTPKRVEAQLFFLQGGALVHQAVTLEVPVGAEAFNVALQALAHPPSGLSSVLPSGLPAPVAFLVGETAYVDLPAAYRSLHMGVAHEVHLLYGIAETLFQFPPIQKVRFLVNHQPVDSLGHLSLLLPITPSS
jgi:hypothetical protein